MKALILLAALATPIQAEELRDCREVANEFINTQAALGMVPAGIRQFPDAVMISFESKDQLHKITMLVTSSPEGYSPKKGSKLVGEGHCSLKGSKAYWGVSASADKRARTQF